MFSLCTEEQNKMLLPASKPLENFVLLWEIFEIFLLASQGTHQTQVLLVMLGGSVLGPKNAVLFGSSTVRDQKGHSGGAWETMWYRD